MCVHKHIAKNRLPKISASNLYSDFNGIEPCVESAPKMSTHIFDKFTVFMILEKYTQHI